MNEQVIEVELNEEVLNSIEDETQTPVDIDIEDIIDEECEINEDQDN